MAIEMFVVDTLRQDLLRRITPSNDQLRALAAKLPPPASWFDSDEEDDPAWPGLFAAVGVRLRDALGSVALRIDHIGSTAVSANASRADRAAGDFWRRSPKFAVPTAI